MKKERTHTENINPCIDRVRLIRRMNALISSLPRLAQDRPIEMAAQPETLKVRQRKKESLHLRLGATLLLIFILQANHAI